MDLHDVPKNGTSHDLDHRLWPGRGFLGEPRAHSSSKYNRFHHTVLAIPLNSTSGKFGAEPSAAGWNDLLNTNPRSQYSAFRLPRRQAWIEGVQPTHTTVHLRIEAFCHRVIQSAPALCRNCPITNVTLVRSRYYRTD